MKLDYKIFTKSNKFSFKDKNIIKNFDEHILKSIPNYIQGQNIVVSLSNFFLNNGSTFYDLGCSTGSLIQKIQNNNNDIKTKYIGLDISQEMISFAKKKKIKNCSFLKRDIVKENLKNSDMIVSMFTMQFIPTQHRQKVFKKIYKSLNVGGAFILFEKIRANNAIFQDLFNFLYFDFKKNKNFSSDEILNKEKSLRGIMKPLTLDQNNELLKKAGFKNFNPIIQYVNFIGILCIK